jgi:hypothetical protein
LTVAAKRGFKESPTPPVVNAGDDGLGTTEKTSDGPGKDKKKAKKKKPVDLAFNYNETKIINQT